MNTRQNQTRLPLYFFVINSLVIAFCCSLTSSRFLTAVDTGDWGIFNFLFFFVFAFCNYFFLNFLATCIIGGIPTLLKWNKLTFALTFFTDTIFIILFVADTFVFQQFRLHLNLAMLQMTLLGGGQVVQFSTKMMGQIALLVALCTFVSFFCVFIATKASKRKSRSFFVLTLPLLGFVFCNLWYGYSYATHQASFTEISEILPANRPIRFNKLLVKYGIVSAEEVAGTKLDFSKFKNGMHYPLEPLNCPQTNTKPMNIVFLYIDSLRFDVLDEKTMPSLWNFSKEAIRFDDHWSGGINTRHGIFTIFYGIPGSYWSKALSTKTPSILIQALEKRDYQIGAFTGAPLTMPEFNQTVFSGLKNLRLESSGESVIDRDNNAILDFENWIQNRNTQRPFFSFIFLDNVHANQFPETEENIVYQPYWKTVNHLELNNDFDPKPFFNRYKNSAHFADKQTERIISFLKKQELLKDTIVVISSDHGEEFNDNKQNFWSHNGNFTAVQAKVPLVIYWPGKNAGKIEYRTSSLDIVPTILPDALNCKNPISDYSSGFSLWKDSKRPFVYGSNYSKDAFIEKDRTIIIDGNGGGLSFVDSQNRKIPEERVPAYINGILKENSKFLK